MLIQVGSKLINDISGFVKQLYRPKTYRLKALCLVLTQHFEG